MAKTPVPPPAAKIKRADPIRLAIARFIERDLWKLIVVLAVVYLMASGTVNVSGFIFRFTPVDQFSFELHLGSTEEW